MLFGRMQYIDQHIADVLNALHKRQAAGVNKNRTDLKPLTSDKVVWYKRPPGTGGKLDSRWLGPCVVVGREGEYSYVVQTGQNSFIKAHRTSLKEYWEDTHAEICKHMYFHKRTVPSPREISTQLRVKRILHHVENEDGSLSSLTQREGEDEALAEYLPPEDFLSEEGQTFVQYCKENGLQEALGIFSSEPDV